MTIGWRQKLGGLIAHGDAHREAAADDAAREQGAKEPTAPIGVMSARLSFVKKRSISSRSFERPLNNSGSGLKKLPASARKPVFV